MRKFIDIIAGTRPNLVKLSALLHAIHKLPSKQKIAYRYIYTNQHTSSLLFKQMLKDLEIPKPNISLHIVYGTNVSQSASIMAEYDKVLQLQKPILCIVIGDVASTMACALTAKLNNVPVAHVESGLRSNNHAMPEEINRIVIDSIANYHFVTTQAAKQNVINSGVKKSNVHFVGNTVIDSLIQHLEKIKRPVLFKELGLKDKQYYLLTLHRPSNVDNKQTFQKIITSISKSIASDTCIFLAHPRTIKNIKTLHIRIPKNIILCEPQSYLYFLYSLKHCKAVFTDSGGVSEESSYLNIPCITLRDETERPETVELGTNLVIKSKYTTLPKYIKLIQTGKWKTAKAIPLWDGNAADRIINRLQTIVSQIN